MASLIIPPLATSAPIALAASDKLAAWSFGAFKVIQTGTYINAPDTEALLEDVEANSAPYLSAAVSAAAEFVIDAYGGFPVFYEVGVTPAVKAATLLSGYMPAPTALNATGALTAAMILGRIVTSTTAAAVAATLPTGAVLAAASEWAVGECVEWTIIATGANDFTVTAATDHTVVGGSGAAFVVPTLTSCRAITRQVSAGVFVTYAAARAIS